MAKELQKSIFCEFVPFHVKAHPTFTAQSSVSKMTASSWPLSEGEFQDSMGFQPTRFYKFPCGLPGCSCLTVSRPKRMHCQMAGMTWQSGRSGCRPPRQGYLASIQRIRWIQFNVHIRNPTWSGSKVSKYQKRYPIGFEGISQRSWIPGKKLNEQVERGQVLWASSLRSLHCFSWQSKRISH